MWAALEPGLGRIFGTPLSDVKLVGRAVTRGRLWPVAGFAIHVGNGAVFGWTFERLGLRGVRRGVLAAEAENLVLWPGMLLVDRFHPDCRSGAWPPLAKNPRAFAYEATTHGLFGAALGALLRD